MTFRLKSLAASALLAALALPAQSAVATITFDTLVTGQTSFGFDGDGDSIDDVVFSTTDPTGFNTLGPGLAQLYISEPGLEGTTVLSADLRVNFLNGATGSVTFGFALSTSGAAPGTGASLALYDSSDQLLGSASVLGALFSLPGGGTSTFVEGELSLAFAGTASYGLFDFTGAGDRYIIDNFSGNFGSVIPEPGSALLLLLGVAALAWHLPARHRLLK